MPATTKLQARDFKPSYQRHHRLKSASSTKNFRTMQGSKSNALVAQAYVKQSFKENTLNPKMKK